MSALNQNPYTGKSIADLIIALGESTAARTVNTNLIGYIGRLVAPEGQRAIFSNTLQATQALLAYKNKNGNRLTEQEIHTACAGTKDAESVWVIEDNRITNESARAAKVREQLLQATL